MEIPYKQVVYGARVGIIDGFWMVWRYDTEFETLYPETDSISPTEAEALSKATHKNQIHGAAWADKYPFSFAKHHFIGNYIGYGNKAGPESDELQDVDREEEIPPQAVGFPERPVDNSMPLPLNVEETVQRVDYDIEDLKKRSRQAVASIAWEAYGIDSRNMSKRQLLKAIEKKKSDASYFRLENMPGYEEIKEGDPF
jgi:hypothetical protein